MSVLAPADEAELAEIITQAYRDATPLAIRGGGTLEQMLRPVQAARTVRMDACTGVTLHAPRELVFSARAGTTMREVARVLAADGQHVVAEPPDYSRLMGTDTAPTLGGPTLGGPTLGGPTLGGPTLGGPTLGGPTLGGLVAANLSGPRRIAAGAMRDHVLGMRAVNGTGELLVCGGRVLKNVTGLDMCKLLAGSHGTLAVMTEISLKVLPAPESSATVVLYGLTPEAAIAALAAGVGSPFGVSGAAYLPARAAALIDVDGPVALLRLEDFASSVAYRSEKLAAQFGPAATIWQQPRSAAAWAAIRDADVLPAAPEDAIWRISVRPSRGPAVLAAAQAAGAEGYLDWAGGLAMIAGPPKPEMHAAITTAVRAAGGIWTLLRAPAPLRAEVPVVPPEAPALAGLTRRVKAAMDPGGILNPGRMFAGV